MKKMLTLSVLKKHTICIGYRLSTPLIFLINTKQKEIDSEPTHKK